MENKKIDLELQLSKHFKLKEFVRSGTAIMHGIDNTPPLYAVENLRALCENVLEPLRCRFGVLRITSGYRCQALNKAVGGVKNSQHLMGEAADIYIPNQEIGMKMLDFIEKNLPYHQVLFERRKSDNVRWMHVSYRQKQFIIHNAQFIIHN